MCVTSHKKACAPSVGGFGLLCFIKREGSVHFVECLQKSLAVQMFLLDGYANLCEKREGYLTCPLSYTSFMTR